MDSVRYIVGQEETAKGISKPGAYGDIEVRKLVEKAADGDIQSFGELYSIHLDRIYRYVFYHVSNKATAEDLTEEIFIKAWEGISKYQWKGPPFSAWLYRIARNHVIDYFRTSHQDKSLEVDFLPDDNDPEQEVEEKQIQQSLLGAISCLPQQQRQLIILKFIEGLDNREISEIMQKSQEAIRIMQMRALATLRQRLNKEMGKCELN